MTQGQTRTGASGPIQSSPLQCVESDDAACAVEFWVNHSALLHPVWGSPASTGPVLPRTTCNPPLAIFLPGIPIRLLGLALNASCTVALSTNAT